MDHQSWAAEVTRLMERRWAKGDFLGGAPSFDSLPYRLARCHVGELCFECAKPGHTRDHCPVRKGRGRALGGLPLVACCTRLEKIRESMGNMF